MQAIQLALYWYFASLHEDKKLGQYNFRRVAISLRHVAWMVTCGIMSSIVLVNV